MLTEATVAVNVVVDVPEATVTLAGTVTALSLLATLTPRPPDGAAELSDTVHAVVAAPVKELLPHENALIEGANAAAAPPRLIDVVFEVIPCVAVRVAVCDVVTTDTVARKFALVEPEGTDTETGTVTAPLLLAKPTAMPLLGAGALNVTLQESVPAPIIDELAQLSPAREAADEADPCPCNFTAPATFAFVVVIAFILSCPVESVAEPGS